MYIYVATARVHVSGFPLIHKQNDVFAHPIVVRMIQYSYDLSVDYVLYNFIFVLRMCDVNAVARIG